MKGLKSALLLAFCMVLSACGTDLPSGQNLSEGQNLPLGQAGSDFAALPRDTSAVESYIAETSEKLTEPETSSRLEASSRPEASSEPEASSGEIPIAPVTEEWKSTVYFGSEFPFVIYADEKTCIFSEGAVSLFIYDFDKKEITFSANITESFNNAGITGFGAPGWNGVSMSAYRRDDGGTGIICSLYWFDGDRSESFELDTDNRILTPADISDREITFLSGRNPPDGSAAENSGFDIYYFGDGNYVRIADSGLANGVLPGEGSWLPAIELVRSIDGEETRFLPFEDMK